MTTGGDAGKDREGEGGARGKSAGGGENRTAAPDGCDWLAEKPEIGEWEAARGPSGSLWGATERAPATAKAAAPTTGEDDAAGAGGPAPRPDGWLADGGGQCATFRPGAGANMSVENDGSAGGGACPAGTASAPRRKSATAFSVGEYSRPARKQSTLDARAAAGTTADRPPMPRPPCVRGRAARARRASTAGEGSRASVRRRRSASCAARSTEPASRPPHSSGRARSQ